MTAERDSLPRWRLWVLLAAAAYWMLDLAVFGNGVPAVLDDTWEYAVAARHLLSGDGFVTSVIHPPLWGLRDEALRVPLLIHGPLLPLVFVPLLAAFGAAVVDHVAWLSAGFALLTAAVTFRLAARHFGAAAGAGAALLYTLSPLTLTAVHHDIALTAGALCLVLALDALARDSPAAIAAGAWFGLGYLARPEFLLGVPLLMLFRTRVAHRFIAAFVIVALPWWWHHWMAVGSPFFNLSSYLVVGYWGRWPDLTILRDFHVPPAEWPAVLRDSFGALPAKWADFFPHAAKRALTAPSVGTGALVVIGVVMAVRRQVTRPAALLATGLAAIPVAVMTLTVYDVRYIAPFLPLWSIAAAAGAVWIASAAPSWASRPRVWLSLLALIALPSAVTAWRLASSQAVANAATLRVERAALRDDPAASREAAPVRPRFSDWPDFTAWETGVPTVWITQPEYDALPPCATGSRGRMPSAGTPDALPCRGETAITRFH